MADAPPPLKLGLLGAGAAVRKLHLPALNKLRGEIEIAGVWSRSPERARSLAAELGIERSFADHRELLADRTIEAVLIAVPIELNASFAIEAIKAGKHVLAEKPIAATTAEARQMLDACQSTQCVVAIAENFRYRDDILQARRLIEAGEIGRVQCFQITTVFDLLADVRRVYIEQPWRKEPQHAGGLVVDAGVHAVSGLREILGDVDHVCARLLNNSPATSGPDGLVMQLGLVSGVPGQYLACYTAKTDRETVFDLSVYGDEGSLWLTEGKVEWFSARTGKRQTWQVPPDRGYLAQWKNFLAAVRGREPVYSTAAKAYDDLLVLECALSSAASGQPVRVGKGAS
ncbi:MAG TPA: Gfo/Idh/MocA family oxidoreductase [Pirellulales bacterium]|jgi:predicted dehydrogenase|nr:Gfo/Idh/MocA family oxidoreductase [Pirellulales bacterium]